MSQASFNIPNILRSLFRGSINAAIQALATLSSGASAPSETYPFMWWADTSAKKLKQRKSDDSAWITMGLTDQPNGLSVLRGPVVAGGTDTDITASFGITTLSEDLIFAIEHTTVNLGPVTLNIDGTGSHSCYTSSGVQLSGHEIPGSGWIGLWRYDASSGYFILLNPACEITQGDLLVQMSVGTGTFTGTYLMQGNLMHIDITGTVNAQTNAAQFKLYVEPQGDPRSRFVNYGVLARGKTSESTLMGWEVTGPFSYFYLTPFTSTGANISITTMSGDTVRINGVLRLSSTAN